MERVSTPLFFDFDFPSLMRHSYLLCLLVLLLPSLTVRGQIPCQDGGVLDPSDNQFYPCEGTSLLGRLTLEDLGVPINPATSLPYRGNDVWGWTDPDSGIDFALVGNQSGVYFAEVTPSTSVALGRLPTETTATTWRDIKVYQNTAYVVADGAGAHGIQVFDLTRLRGLAPDPGRIFVADAIIPDIGSAHNIFVHEDTGYLYVVGGDLCAGGPVFFDLTDPGTPVQSGCFSADGATHDIQCVLYAGPDPDYQGREICMLSNGDALTIIDATDKANPVVISQGFYPNIGYVHQGWFEPTHQYWYQDDESDELQGLTPETRTLRFDLQDLDAPLYRDAYLHGTASTDHNLYTRGDYIYLSNNTSGLRVLYAPIADPDATLFPVGYFDTHPESDAAGFQGAWSVYPFFESGTLLVNDRTRGLFVLGAFDPTTVDTAPSPPEQGLQVTLLGANPFRDHTHVRIQSATPHPVVAMLFDALGRRVGLVFSGEVSAGQSQVVRVDGSDLAPGLYILRVSSPDGHVAHPLILTR